MSAVRTFLLMLAALVAAVLIDGLVSRATHGFRVVDPYLIVVIVFASRGPKVRAMLVGGVAGFVQDLVASGVFGIHYLGKLVVGYVASLLSGRLIPGQALTAAVLLGGGTILEKVVFVALGPLLGNSFSAGTFSEAVVQVGVNTVLGMVAFRLLERFDPKKPGPGGSRGR